MRRDEFVAALMLLTRLPVGRLARTAPPPGQAVWAYPVVGAMVGLAGAGVFWAAAAAGLPPTLSALFAVATTMLLTGALHEDGLADTADGFGGGRDRRRKLEIMRDSRIGSYGALALILSLAVRVAALAAMRHPAVAMIVSGALGRGAMVGLLLMLRPARPDGLAASLGMPPRWATVAGLGLAVLIGGAAPMALPAAVLAALAMATLARRQIGGYTGDVLGATEQAAECAVLTALLIR